MSHKRKQDYREVFKAIWEMLKVEGDDSFPRCKEFMQDFEMAAWQGAKLSILGVKLVGCNFHICQAKFRYLKKIGMGPLYKKDQTTRKICRQLLSLNLLPAEKIGDQFYLIMSKASGLLLRFCSYIEKQWINHTVWPPFTWSMFMQFRRNNNNAEGFHNLLKSLVGTNSPNLIKFLGIIKNEADKIDLKAKLLSQHKALLALSKNTQEMQYTLSQLWEAYSTKTLNARQLLESCGE